MELKINKSKLDELCLIILAVTCVGNLGPEFQFGIKGFGLFQVAHLPVLVYLSVRSVKFFSTDTLNSFNPILLIVFFLLIFYISVSLFWSEIEILSVIRLFILLLLLLSSFYLSFRFSISEITQVLVKPLLLFLLLNVVISIGIPSVGQDKGFHAGAWEGFYVQKNVLGRYCLFGALVLVLANYYNTVSRRFFFIGFTLFAFVCFFTQSRTSFGLIIILPILLYALVAIYRYRLSVMLLIFLPLLVIVLMSGAEFGKLNTANDFISFYGVELYLTGRPTIWVYVVDKVFSENISWFGYGFDGFWRKSSLQYYVHGLGTVLPTDSLNGFVDVFLQFGYIGLFIFLLLLCFMLVSLSLNLHYLIYLFLFLFLLVSNLTESYFFKSTNIFSLLFFYVFFNMRRKLA